MSDNSPKIIVDDDWKSQVEKEKQMAAGQHSEPTQPASDEISGSSSHAHDDALQPPPDASFETLLTMLFTQGMASLGQLPGGPQGAGAINKPFAKHFIDTIEMLGEKTKGNLTEEESRMLSEILHALRMMFVSIKSPK